jgi:4'-phosphopantetheinyl transferase
LLGPDEIHLWLTDYAAIEDDSLIAAYHALLNEAEREQQQRFRFAKDRRRYLVTRALVRSALSGYAPVAPEEWRFTTNAWGRPEIANVDAGDLTFNVSHTHSLIALAVTRGRAVGVDVENWCGRDVSPGIAERFFAPTEAAALRAILKSRQQERFFEYWTLKESYIKARGMGLSIPLDQFSFSFRDDGSVSFAVTLDDDPSRWRFWQFRPRPEYVMALCAEGAALVTISETVPLQP